MLESVLEMVRGLNFGTQQWIFKMRKLVYLSLSR